MNGALFSTVSTLILPSLNSQSLSLVLVHGEHTIDIILFLVLGCPSHLQYTMKSDIANICTEWPNKLCCISWRNDRNKICFQFIFVWENLNNQVVDDWSNEYKVWVQVFWITNLRLKIAILITIHSMSNSTLIQKKSEELQLISKLVLRTF